MKMITFTLLCLCLAACSGSKMGQLKNAELSARRDECLRKNPTAPGAVAAGENVRKECERRRKQGNYAC